MVLNLSMLLSNFYKKNLEIKRCFKKTKKQHLLSVKKMVMGGIKMSRKGENIYHRKDGRWEGRYIKFYSQNNKAIYGYVYAHTYGEAKDKLLVAKSNVNREKAKYLDITFAESAFYWLNKKNFSVKESTQARYEDKIRNHINPAFANYKISEITTIDLEKFVHNLISLKGIKKDTTLSAKTVSDTLIILKSILKHSEQLGCKLNCNLDCLKIKIQSKEIKVISKEEQMLVNQKILDSQDYTSVGILLSLYTGIRIGELCAMTIDDIDVNLGKMKVWKTLQRIPDKSCEKRKTKLIFLEPKTKKSKREIPLASFVLNIIKSMNYSSGCFLLSGTTTPVEPRTMENRYKKFMKELNITNTSFHSLRHTFATRCIEANFDIKTLSDLLGHSSVSITLNRYVHSSYDLKVENMNKITFSI